MVQRPRFCSDLIFRIAFVLSLDANHAPDHLLVDPATPSFEEEDEDEDLNNVAEVCDPSDNEEQSVIEEEPVVEPPTTSRENESPTVVDSAPVALEDAPKKSYASIVGSKSFFFFLKLDVPFLIQIILYTESMQVKVMKSSAASTPAFATGMVRVARPTHTDQQLAGSAKSAPAREEPTPTINSAPESSNINEEGKHFFFLGLIDSSLDY